MKINRSRGGTKQGTNPDFFFAVTVIHTLGKKAFGRHLFSLRSFLKLLIRKGLRLTTLGT